MTNEQMKQELERKKQELLNKIDVLHSNVAVIDSAIQVFSIGQTIMPEEIRLRGMIYKAIEAAPEQFSLKDIEHHISIQCLAGQDTPKVSIASSFWKIANEELKLPIVQKGEGRRPTIYRKISGMAAGEPVKQ